MWGFSVYKALKTINSVQDGSQALSNLAKVQKSFGAFYRDVRAINLAMAESKLEGGMVKRDLIDELYRDFVDKHGSHNLEIWWITNKMKGKTNENS